MGFSREKFQSLPPHAQAKKCADLLRVILLRLGPDWKRAIEEYNHLSSWYTAPAVLAEPRSLDPSRLDHRTLLELYRQWRSLAGLGAERDVDLFPDPADRPTPAGPVIPWEILAHNLRSAYNAGSVLRTADCFGLRGVHASGYTAPPDHPSLRSAARGAEQWVPYRKWDSPWDCLTDCRNRGMAIIALELTPQAVPLEEFSWPRSGLLVLGNEELGIARDLLQKCDAQVYIPLYGRKASLNVASALAIAAHAIRRNV